jgi:hypothetical protein
MFAQLRKDEGSRKWIRKRFACGCCRRGMELALSENAERELPGPAFRTLLQYFLLLSSPCDSVSCEARIGFGRWREATREATLSPSGYRICLSIHPAQ